MSQVVLGQIAKLTPDQAKQTIAEIPEYIAEINEAARFMIALAALTCGCATGWSITAYLHLPKENELGAQEARANFGKSVGRIASFCLGMLCCFAIGHYVFLRLARNITDVYLPELQKVANQGAN